MAQTVAALPAVRGEQVDATDRGQLDALFDRLGEIDHLVVCVSGGAGAGPFAALDLMVLRRAFAAKTFAQLEAVQAALSHLTRAGSVTLVTAASAQAAFPGTAGLAAVNGALEAAVRPLAAELAPLRVNAVSPGVVDTPGGTPGPTPTAPPSSLRRPSGSRPDAQGTRTTSPPPSPCSSATASSPDRSSSSTAAPTSRADRPCATCRRRGRAR